MNNLDSLLQTAREVKNAQPLVERDELISIAGRYTSDAPSTTHAAQASSITSIKTVMNIIASLLVVGAAAWYGLSNHDQQSQQLQTPTPSTASISTSSQNAGVANTAEEFSKGDNQCPSTQRDVNSTSSNIIRVIELSPAELAKLGIIQSDSTIECSYEREMKVYQDAARLVAKFERLGYDTDRENEVVQARMLFTADSTHIDFVANTNSDRTKSSPLCPAEGFYCTPNKSQMSFTPTGYSPRLEFHARDKVQNEFFQLLSLMGLGDPKKLMEFSTVPREATLSYLNKLVPLRITMNKDAKPWVLLLWFVPTPEFVNALPQRWQESVRSSVTLCDSVVISKEDLIAHKKDIAKQRQDRESIAGIEALKLSATELTNLGISVQGDSVFIPIEEYISKTDTLPPSFKDSTLRKSYAIKHQELLKKLQALNYDITADQILVRSTRSFALSGSEDKRTLLYAQWDNSKPNPLCAVGHNKVLWNYKRSKQNAEISWDSYFIVNNLIDAAPMLRMPSLKTTSSSRDSSSNPNSYPIEMMYSTLCSKAIPVEIEFDNINSLVEHARNTKSKLDSTAFRKMTLRLWFVPTQEFIEHLPERYRSVMQREYKLLEKVIKGEIQAEQACTELQDNKASSYLQLCQYSSGTLRSLSLAPNPAESQVSCNYVLSQSSPITIKLYNDKGSFVSELVSNYQAKAGPNTIDLNLPQLSSGFYIIVLSNDRGEQITQRLAVQR